MIKRPKIVFIQTSLGHYHYPRMQNLSDRCQQEGMEFQNIELSSFIRDYPWVVNRNQKTFENITLFPGQMLEKIPAEPLWRALQDQLFCLKPDVVFILGYSTSIMRRATRWVEKENVPSVIISDSNDFDKRRYFPLEYYKSTWVSRFDAAFAAGKTSSLYIQKLGIPPHRITTGCDVIDSSLFIERSDENRKNPAQGRKRIGLEGPYFLFVARLIKEKNLPELLDAYRFYASSIQNPWNLVICGSGPQENYVKKKIRSFPVEIRERIILRGYVAQPEIIDYFTFANCFVLPSIYEPWGLVVNEALACGIPVLVSNKAGSSFDLVKNGENGWTFNPNHTPEITEHMLRMHKLGEKNRENLGRFGRLIVENWGLEKFSNGAIDAAKIAMEYHPKTKQAGR